MTASPAYRPVIESTSFHSHVRPLLELVVVLHYCCSSSGVYREWAKDPSPPSLPASCTSFPDLQPTLFHSLSLPQSMPPRLRGLLAKSLSRPLDSVFYCPSCATWRRLSTRAGVNNYARGEKTNTAHRPLNPAAIPAPRPLSTSPIVSAGKAVPPRFKELYGALEGVRDAAIEQVSLSRLQLALRGLESETPLIRVAGEYQTMIFFSS